MRNQNCTLPYSAHGLKQLSDVLKLHKQIVWINPNTNQVAVRHLSPNYIESKMEVE